MFRLRDILTKDECRIAVFLVLIIFLGLTAKYIIVLNSEGYSGILHAEEVSRKKIDIRIASKSELMSLPGIGEVKAVRILEYRRQKQFESTSELREVKGIGYKTMEKLKPWLVCFGSDSLEVSQNDTLVSLELIDINQAGLEELMSLPGIGAVKAKRIIDRREKEGKFSSVDELIEIKGIGEKTLAKLKPLIKCER